MRRLRLASCSTTYAKYLGMYARNAGEYAMMRTRMKWVVHPVRGPAFTRSPGAACFARPGSAPCFAKEPLRLWVWLALQPGTRNSLGLR